MTEYEPVIGLETRYTAQHAVQIFCTCKADSWEEAANTKLPGLLRLSCVLPVLNRAVVEKAVLLARAMNSQIRPLSIYSKNYFYPDLPKGYQISQFRPIPGRRRLFRPTHAWWRAPANFHPQAAH